MNADSRFSGLDGSTYSLGFGDSHDMDRHRAFVFAGDCVFMVWFSMDHSDS
jgi:hypothetical protein